MSTTVGGLHHRAAARLGRRSGSSAIPATGSTGSRRALRRAADQVEFVQVRHEETAGFLAGAHVKYGGGAFGVCLVTSGPGAIHALNGLYDAKLDGQPVVAILGQQARTVLGGGYYQEIDLQSLYKDVAGAFCQTATHPAQIRHLVDRAVRIALADRTVTAIIVPNDLQELEAVTDAPAEHGRLRSSVGYTAPRVVPEQTDLQRAADVLNAGRAGRDARRRAARSARPPRSRRSPTRSAPAWRRRCSAAPCSPTASRG